MAAAPIFPGTITQGVAQILPADTTTLKTLYTAGASGSVINHIRVSSTDSVARDVVLWLTIGGVDYRLSTVSIPASSGFTAIVPSISYLDSANMPNAQDINGNKVLYLATGAVLKVSSLITVTSTRVIQFYAQAGDF